jgi:hypothetical protein
VKEPIAEPIEEPTTVLGNWYATAVFWKPQVAVFVNETTFLPVLVTLAPASSLALRFPESLFGVLRELEVDPSFFDLERAEMASWRFSKTASRRVLGVMNEFVAVARRFPRPETERDLRSMSLQLAEIPVGPLRARSGYPSVATEQLITDFLATGRVRRAEPIPQKQRMERPPDLDLEKIRRFAATRFPAKFVAEMRVECEIKGFEVVLYGARAPWTKELGPEWTRLKVAQLQFHPTKQRWTLSWSDSDGIWHRYDLVRPGGIDRMLEEIEDDPTGIFWG